MGMKVVIAPDSFKESMTAKEASEAIALGIRRAIPDAECILVPMADGGEGTVQSLVDATGGTLVEQSVMGPLGNSVTAVYGMLGDGQTAVIEMASASGLHLVPREQRNPMVTTTYGTGELIRACIVRGVSHIIIGLGGSATNDAGTGMAKALGYRFLDEQGNELPLGGGYLHLLHRIDCTHVIPQLKNVNITIASDVKNPLYGERGAAKVFARQKGASAEMIVQLDSNLQHFSKVVEQQFKCNVAHIEGAGAAGGLGAGLLAFTSATISSGVEAVISFTGLREKLEGASICITGEGGIDSQTQFGKTPYGVAKAAKQVDNNIAVIALGGYITEDSSSLYEHGIDAVFGITPGAAELDELLQNGAFNLARTAENVARLLVLKRI